MRLAVRMLFALAGLVAVALAGAWFWPAEQLEPPVRKVVDESAFNLGSTTGWYELEGGSQRLLTFGAESGVVLYGFGAARADLDRTVLTPESSTRFTAPDGFLEFSLDDDGAIVAGTLSDADGTRTLTPVTGPYATREVFFDSGNLRLAGLLFLPNGDGPHPGTVFIHGSGASNRDQFWYLSVADHLARQGIAVLLPDKRGTGKSEGQWHDASFDEIAADAIAAFELLRQTPAIDPDRVGLVGFSQGGWVAPLAAVQTPDAAFLATVSASAVTPRMQLLYEVRQDMLADGAPEFAANLFGPLIARRAQLKKASWWSQNGPFDPLPYWRELDIPALLLFGLDDRNVDVPRTLAVLEAASVETRYNVRVEALEGTGHALIDPQTGWLVADYLADLSEFILDR